MDTGTHTMYVVSVGEWTKFDFPITFVALANGLTLTFDMRSA